ncbi:hypothetical protein HYH03_009690 [Edaphochlamys debaryana]|uniref:Uncharacterized protein n=1 Tax=Edaphochlamys debaryana TaxID=47281 RepID=A0A835Y6L5_9CHLO|nr:hypothetical protein HYH03_009690 [Edaphochlamys debaryana]|eukprot:KAG2491959.1 hypothetical protein HYH03_009690 [Edaphochlamys debaryana]
MEDVSTRASGTRMRAATRQYFPAPPAPPGAWSTTDPKGCTDQFKVGGGILSLNDVDTRELVARAMYRITVSEALLGDDGFRLVLPEEMVLRVAYSGVDTVDEYRNGNHYERGWEKIIDDIPVRADVDLIHYPFDKYQVKLDVEMALVNTTDNTEHFVPFVAAMKTRSPSFDYNAPAELIDLDLMPNLSSFTFDVQVQRTSTARAFSIFVFIMMWALTLFCVTYCIYVCFVRTDEPVTFDIPGFTATLLFALPAVRDAQPGVPEVGCIMDVSGYIWNMALLALCCCLLLLRIYAQRNELRRLGRIDTVSPMHTGRVIYVGPAGSVPGGHGGNESHGASGGKGSDSDGQGKGQEDLELMTDTGAQEAGARTRASSRAYHPAPPAPPGARGVTDPGSCMEQFKPLFDYDYYDVEESPWGSFPAVYFLGVIEDVDTRELVARAMYRITVSEALLGDDGFRIVLPEEMVLTISYSVKIIDDIPVRADVDLIHYPFDKYQVKLEVEMTLVNTTDNTEHFVPFVAAMKTRSPSFEYSAPAELIDLDLMPELSSFTFDVKVQRTATARAFSIFVFIMMWALTLFCVTYCIYVCFVRTDEPVTFDIPGFTATLLFALPAVRDTQPGVPEVGCIMDVSGYIWNMALLALCCCLLLLRIYAQRNELRRLGRIDTVSPMHTGRVIYVGPAGSVPGGHGGNESHGASGGKGSDGQGKGQEDLERGSDDAVPLGEAVEWGDVDASRLRALTAASQPGSRSIAPSRVGGSGRQAPAAAASVWHRMH